MWEIMNKRVTANFNILAHKMDLDYDFHKKLYKMFPKYEDCPDKWKPAWRAFEADGFKCWRDMPKVVKRIKKAASRKVKK
jgi:hypothetical protein